MNYKQNALENMKKHRDMNDTIRMLSKFLTKNKTHENELHITRFV